MYNELLFLIHTSCIAGFTLVCARIGDQALISFMSIQVILANLFVIKQIHLFGLTATATDAFTIGGVLSLNLIHEFYGKAMARKALLISFILLLFYTIVSQLHIAYLPILGDMYAPHYTALLSVMPRITLASLAAYAVVTYLDIILYAWLRKLWGDRYFVIRNYCSIAFCQLIDTILFSFLGLYGIVGNLATVILVSYGIKMATLAVATPFLAIAQRICYHKKHGPI